MKYKGFEDNRIDELVEKLEISISEACDLILEESGKVEESAETKAEIKAKETADRKNKRRYEKSDKPRKSTTKERKVDETKGKLLTEVKALMEEMGASALEMKTETELHFTFEGANYTFKLTKHRPPKKQAVQKSRGKTNKVLPCFLYILPIDMRETM